MKKLSLSGHGESNNIVRMAVDSFIRHRSGFGITNIIEGKDIKLLQMFLVKNKIDKLIKNSEMRENANVIVQAILKHNQGEKTLEEYKSKLNPDDIYEIEFQAELEDGTVTPFQLSVTVYDDYSYRFATRSIGDLLHNKVKEILSFRKVEKEPIDKKMSTSSASGDLEVHNLLEEVIKANIEYDSYESDLYLPATKKVEALLKRLNVKPSYYSTFESNVDWKTEKGSLSYEVPFAFDKRLEYDLKGKYKRYKAKASSTSDDLSPAQKEYQDFFKAKLEAYDVDSPADLSEEDKSKFFDEIKKEYKGKSDHFFNLKGDGFTVEIENGSLFVIPKQRDPMTNEVQIELSEENIEWRQEKNEYVIKPKTKIEARLAFNTLGLSPKWKKVASMFSETSTSKQDIKIEDPLNIITHSTQSKAVTLSIKEWDDMIGSLVDEVRLYTPIQQKVKGAKTMDWHSGTGFSLNIYNKINYDKDIVEISKIEILNESETEKPAIKTLAVLNRFKLKSVIKDIGKSIHNSIHFKEDPVTLTSEEFKELEDSLRGYASLEVLTANKDLEGREVASYRLVEGSEGVLELDIIYVTKGQDISVQVIKLEKTIQGVKPLVRVMETLTKFGLSGMVVSWNGRKIAN